MSVPSPSSTVMLLRDTDFGIEALLVQRNPKLTTGGGAWVFPGGRVDAGDYEDDSDFLAAQNAAIRETLEETGLQLKREALTPFAHWTTPAGTGRRFATWFFAAHLEEDAEVRVDGGEIVDYRWIVPRDALEAQRRGDILIMPPTFVSLTLLENFESSMAVTADFGQREVQHFRPRILKTDSGRIIFYDDDAGYATLDPDAPGSRHRITIHGRNWHYEDSR